MTEKSGDSTKSLVITPLSVTSEVPNLDAMEEDKDADRIEAEFDEVARYVGPVAKSLFTPVVAPLVDANSFADALGVAPLYKQKESQRWSQALSFYRQLSSQDTVGIQHQMTRVSEDDELSDLYLASEDRINLGHLMDEHLAPRPTAPPPVAAPVAVPARHQNRHPNGSTTTAPLKVLNPGTLSSKTTRLGFMTPPAASAWAAQHTAATTCIISPPRRRSSSVSPREASLNSLELEAIAAVHELQFAVKDIYVSEMLPRTSELIFLNVTTLEGQACCVELTLKGWRVTSLRHDCMNGDIAHLDLHTQYFETIYALMDRISPAYRQRFADALMSKLAAIQADRKDDGETKRSGEDVEQQESEPKAEDLSELEQRQTFT